MTRPEPSYISVAEIKEATFIDGLKTIGDENIKKLIQHAEGQIDNHVGRQKHHAHDSNLDRVFPRCEDYQITQVNGCRTEDFDTPVMPLAVSEACQMQVEHLYLNWWPNRATAQMPVSRGVSSEDIGGDGSYSVDYAPTSFAEATLCDAAKAKLTGFVSRTAAMSLSRP
jgi:hypothetical protein